MTLGEKFNLLFNDFYGCSTVECAKIRKKEILQLVDKYHLNEIEKEARLISYNQYSSYFEGFIANMNKDKNPFASNLETLRILLFRRFRFEEF